MIIDDWSIMKRNKMNAEKRQTGMVATSAGSVVNQE